jgi:hypothetical protein
MIQFVGPSYHLDLPKVDAQRSINLYPSIVESGNGKAPVILRSIPGLIERYSLDFEIRGMLAIESRLFVVAGDTFFELFADYTKLIRGTLNTDNGPVGITNGLTQLVIVDGQFGYVLTLSSNVFVQILDDAFFPSNRAGFLDGYFIFALTGTQQFQVSAIDDATIIDGLDFASSESQPDPIVGHLVDHSELWLFGTSSVEIWINSGGADFPLARNRGAVIETGCVGAFAMCKTADTVIWIGQDQDGGGIVYAAKGYSPQRVSTLAIERMLGRSTALSEATMWAYQQDGHAFVCINAPGLETTLVFDIQSNMWHERAELINGEYAPHRANWHAYVWGKSFVGSSNGKVYTFDRETYTNAGDVLTRDRISPHQFGSQFQVIPFSLFELDLETGVTGECMLRYSNDGAVSWSSFVRRGLGDVGRRETRVRWLRLGAARQRTWHVRCTDAVPFNIIGANVE